MDSVVDNKFQTFSLLDSFIVHLPVFQGLDHPEMQITRRTDGLLLFKTEPSAPLLSAAVGMLLGDPIHNGNFQAKEILSNRTVGLLVTSAALTQEAKCLTMHGNLTDNQHRPIVGFSMSLYSGGVGGLYMTVSYLWIITVLTFDYIS
jgi:hypothetical protein